MRCLITNFFFCFSVLMRRHRCFFPPIVGRFNRANRRRRLGNESPKYEFGSNSVVNVARRHERVTKRRRRGREYRAQAAWHFDSDSSRFATFSCAFPEGNFVTRQRVNVGSSIYRFGCWLRTHHIYGLRIDRFFSPILSPSPFPPPEN